MKLTGSEMIVEALKREGVDTIFAYPGGAVIPIFDTLYNEKDIHVVLTRHEQAAVHAADGYARTTGKTGVCLVTSGPGATNTVTGLATANFDSVPLVCISGQVPRNMIGNDAFQEADTVGITRPVTKHNYIVTERDALAATLKNAFYIAATGRPGPVVVDVPKDILTAPLEETYPEQVEIRGYSVVYNGHKGQIRKLSEALHEARKPLLFVGGGVNISGAAPILRRIVEKSGIPVIASLMGMGAVPSAHPLFLGMVGMHGTYPANMAVSDCDLLIGIGVRFDDRATGELDQFAPHARIIHIDIDPAAIARNVPVEIPIVGDAKNILEELEPQLPTPDLKDWQLEVGAWKEKQKDLWKEQQRNNSGEFLDPTWVIETLAESFPEALVSTEVGQNQMWSALFFNFRSPNTFVTSGGLGTMGYGFPAAVGAQIGNHDKRVINIAGDGSIQMNIQELTTAVHEKLPVIIAILNNSYLGMVRQWQEMFHDKRYSSTFLGNDPGQGGRSYFPDFVKLAEAYGALGIRVETEAEAREAIERAAAETDRPIVIDFLVHPEANVWPMVPPGAGLRDMVLKEEK